jgi:hypothetical protein
MEENKSNVMQMHPEIKEPTMDELKAELMKAQQINAALREQAQKKIDSLNYSNAFQQQQFMLEIIKMNNIFPKEIVEKAIKVIDNFWFDVEEPKQEEVPNGQEQSK